MRESLLAYAKLNLSLAVRGLRPDGFHEIESLVQTVDLADEIEVEVRPGDGIVVENTLAEIEGRDLAERAAEAVLAEKRAVRSVHLRIEKRIPVGAGLGGGSSDAACVLGALDRLVPPRLARDALCRVAAQIGSDVPLFLVGGCAHVTGRGEAVAPLSEVRREVFVVVVPPVRCPTAEVYAAWEDSRAASSLASCLGANDLLPPALSVRPALREWQAVVDGRGLFSGMTGSGSAFYIAFADLADAARQADEIRRARPAAAVFVCNATSVGSTARATEER